MVPSGILNPKVVCVVGNGLVVHLRGLLSEIETLKAAGIDISGRLLLSDRAHIGNMALRNWIAILNRLFPFLSFFSVFDFHQQIDSINEQRLGGKKLGTTHKVLSFLMLPLNFRTMKVMIFVPSVRRGLGRLMAAK